MSSVTLSASGARSLSTTINDPAATRASMPTKAGDSIYVSAGSLGECRILLPPSARIEKRVAILNDTDGKGGTKERRQESWHLVMPHGFAGMFCKPASDTAWPHMSMDVRKWDDPHYYEKGDVAETHDMVELGLATVAESEGGGYAIYDWKSEEA